jgi:hypothetical protein
VPSKTAWLPSYQYTTGKALLILSLALAGPALLSTSAHAKIPKELWVALDGKDTNEGSKSEPLATLEGARDRIRQLRQEDSLPKNGITVWIRGGTYTRWQTFELTAEDSGTETAPITYRNAKNEAVVLLGGRNIRFKPLSDPAIQKRLGPVARAAVQVADLPSQGILDFGELASRGFGRSVTPAHLELFANGQPMTLARWPNNDEWLTISGIPRNTATGDEHGGQLGQLEGGFILEHNRPARWQPSTNWWVHGYWAWDWANSYEQIASIQPDGLIRTTPPHGLYGFRQGQRFYFLNVLEELDTPGEYFVDTTTGQLYFWPPLNSANTSTTVSLLKTPLIQTRNTSHVTFHGLALEATRSHGIEITDGSHCIVSSCRLRNLGNHGVVVTGGKSHEILHCDILNTGDGGVILSGGDRTTLEPASHLVENNHFHHQGRWSKCYVPAIQLSGVGHLARNNLIHDHPHCAILFVGNNHRIEFNEIHHIALETGDVGAIYTGRDWTYRGNRIVHNFIHDTGGVGMGSMGVYMDDCVSGTTISGNLFKNVQRAVFLGGGRDHQVENNVFLDCHPAVAVDGRGLDASPVWHNMIYRTMKDRLAEIPTDLYRSRYPEIADLDPYYQTDTGVPPENNRISGNISLGGEWLTANWHAETSMLSLGDNLLNPESAFRNPDKYDFRLHKKSPARDLNIPEIPFDRMGLYPSDARRDLERLFGTADE